jgi:hypothetical protein
VAREPSNQRAIAGVNFWVKDQDLMDVVGVGRALFDGVANHLENVFEAIGTSMSMSATQSVPSVKNDNCKLP